MRSTILVLATLLGPSAVAGAQSIAPIRNSPLFEQGSGGEVRRTFLADTGKKDRQAGGIFIGILASALGIAVLSDADGGVELSLPATVAIVTAGGLLGYLIESVRKPE
jgi:hypothetical protein